MATQRPRNPSSYLLAHVRAGVLIFSNVSRRLIRKIRAPSSTAMPEPAASVSIAIRSKT